VGITRSSSGEGARLVADVMGDDPVQAEAAVARLAVVGARAVDRVLAALDTAPPPQQARLLQALERIGDARGLAAAEPRLASADEPVAVAAVGAVRPLLQAARPDVAERAMAALASLALDAARTDAVRAAALDALHDLGAEAVAAVNRVLEHDPSAVVRRLAGWTPAPTVAPPGSASPGTDASLAELAAASLPDDPELVRTLAADALRTVPLSDLHRLVVAVRQRERAAHDAATRAQWAAARGALHQTLAARGSRVALYDLRETLEIPGRHLPVTMIAALGRIGDVSCLEPLAAAISGTVDAWEREQLAHAFGEIRRRERLTRRHAVIRRIETKYPGMEQALGFGR